MWCIQAINAAFRWCMYDVLDLYAEPYDPKRPIIGFDEKPKLLREESRKQIPMRPGRPALHDYEYIRRGKANIFVAVDPKAGRRFTAVTERRTRQDFARFMKYLVDCAFPEAETIRVVLDNLNTHNAISIFETFEREEAERILGKLEFHHTPKHGSWLNVAEIELNVMDTECTGRRIKDMDELASEVKAWTDRRNRLGRTIDWRFTRQDADRKMSKYYVA